ncbi:MAG TPA: PaaI family thioesterase [Micromonosporaceae bacterium]
MFETQMVDRERTYTWTSPAVGLAELGQRSGLDLLHAIATGALPPPPMMQTLGITRIDVLPGQVTVHMPAQEFHYNPLGTVHGGVIATLLDTAAGCAVHSTLAAGTGYTSLDLTTKFLRPVTVDSGQLRCVGTVVNRGRSTALAQAQLFDAADRLVAHAMSSCLILDLTRPAGQPTGTGQPVKRAAAAAI